MLVGSEIEVPVMVCASDCSTSTFLLLAGRDGGATFEPMGVPIPSGGNEYAVAALGSITWVPAGGGIIQETTDGGRTWTAITAAGLPASVGALDLTGPTSATAVIIDSGCAGFKTDCWYRDYLVATTDGGRTWTHL